MHEVREAPDRIGGLTEQLHVCVWSPVLPVHDVVIIVYVRIISYAGYCLKQNQYVYGMWVKQRHVEIGQRVAFQHRSNGMGKGSL